MSYRCVLRWTALFLFAAFEALPQATTSLVGTIADQQNALIATAKVTLANTNTGLTRSTVTNESGFYQFLQVPPGNYSVKVEQAGFATMVQQVTLQVNLPVTLNLKLEVGNVTETVNVVGESVTVNTTDATLGNAFNQTQVRQLPLLTRNVVELLNLQPGVTATGEVLGARKDQNNVTLDGVDVNDNQTAGAFKAVLPIPLDSVQEFRVTVGGQGAMLGRSSGGQVSLLTKGGSNSFHGSAYEFHRNTVTAANNWFSNRAGIARETLIRNQFGASAGGRLIRDRAFFFFNYEQRLDRSGSAQSRVVPTESLKQGILRYALAGGGTGQLTPAEVREVDPQHIGVTPAMMDYLKQFPAGNDSSLASDRGLNFTGFRFNAPFKLDYKAYVSKFDFNVDRGGKHTVSWRGTLADNKEDRTLAQFPGQQAASELLDNSRGFSTNYTAVMRPNLINSLQVGFTRQGLEQSGATGSGLSFAGNTGMASIVNFIRGTGRRVPVWNFIDDLTWIKGKHTVTTGANLRFITNNRFSYSPSWPSYGLSRGTMLGLGSDITNGVTSFIRGRDGNNALALNNTVPIVEGMGTLLGMITNVGVTYQYERDGSALPIGEPQIRDFKTSEYEFFLQDSWRVRRDLTLTFGLRYSNYTVPSEQNGLQVNTTVPIDNYFGERVHLQSLGVASNQMPNARLSYELSGPANDGKDWYSRDLNNWAPRFAFAYNPQTSGGGFWSKLWGKNSVLRGGAATVYDRFGSAMIVDFDQLGSVGLATRLGFPASYNMTNAPRYNGSLPALPAAPAGGFPFTPPDVLAVAGTGLGMMTDLRTPYSFLLNLNYARELPGKMTFEVGYVGRLSRKLLLQGDVFTPLTELKDPKSGITWRQMSQSLRAMSDGGLTPSRVESNPSVIAPNAFIENYFPRLTNFYFPGSATANYFVHLYGENDGSDLDAMHLLDRATSFGGPNCMSLYGCHTFFSRQGSAMPTWMNAGRANYHGMTLSLRRAMSSGFTYDFNYTWSHSIDNGSAAEADAGQFGGILQSVYFPQANRGSSDFDIRHNVNVNALYELPFGKNKKFFSSVPGAVDHLIGGWQLSTIMRYRTGLPTTIGGNGLWNTNYWISGRANAIKPFESKVGYNNNGAPSILPNTNLYQSFTDQYPGEVGQRAVLRLDDFLNFDIAVAKSFRLPFEGHRLQFRAEAFNAFNNVNFSNPSLSLTARATFGEFRSASDPRVMQFALRYEF